MNIGPLLNKAEIRKSCLFLYGTHGFVFWMHLSATIKFFSLLYYFHFFVLLSLPFPLNLES